MKKARILLAILLVLCAIVGLCSCGDEKCTMHTDSDGDGKCDKCGTIIEEEPPCTNHTDANGDGKCDTCGAAIEDDTPCTEHTDANGDGKCDICGETMATVENGDLELIKNGEALFQLVVASDANAALRRKLDGFVSDMAKLGITVSLVESDGAEQECEVLVGTVTTRGEKYAYDRYSLGEKGYCIKAIDKKVIVSAGSDSKLVEAFEKFTEDFIGLTSKTKADDIQNVAVKGDDWVEKPQTSYRISSINVAGTDLRGYTIARDYSTATHREAAKSLQSALYSKAGYYLPIVSLEEASDKSIVIRHAEKTETDKGFTVKVEGTKLVILCAYENKFEESFEKFLNTIQLGKGELEFAKNYKTEYEISKVYYKDYGAKGDGVTNDFLAMKAAHDFANEGGQTVYGESGAKYYIGSTLDENGAVQTITIKTNTNWCGATIIIDDDAIESDEEKSYNIFSVVTDVVTEDSFPAATLAAINAAGGLTREATKIGDGFGYPAMLTIFDSNHKIYIRYGVNTNSGADQHEIVLIDENGNIDPSTPLLFDYPELTKVWVKNLDVEPITIQNAKIISRANETNLNGGYKTINRGIGVSRPNTTIKYIDHSIVNEGVKNDGFTGHSYNGIITVTNTSDVEVVSCTLQSRVYYVQGTYEITATRANNVVFKDCTQSNFWTDDTKKTVNMSLCWGIAGTNYCKNLVYDHSTLTRYDAHSGVVNGKIINGSEVATIRLIGGGDFLIEDSTIWTNSKSIVQLRSDYGATFRGTVTIRNCTVTGTTGITAPTAVFDAPSANHYFGYTTYFPDLVLDNVKITNLKKGDTLSICNTTSVQTDSSGGRYRPITEDTISVAGATASDGKANENPYMGPTSIKVVNNAANGYTLTVLDVPFFKDTVLDGAEKVKFQP